MVDHPWPCRQAAGFYPRFDHVIDHADDILAGGFLDVLESGRAVDLKDFWRCQSVANPHRFAQPQGRAGARAVRSACIDNPCAGPAAVQGWTEVAIRAGGGFICGIDFAVDHRQRRSRPRS